MTASGDMHDDVVGALGKELSQLARENDYRYQVVLRLAAGAQQRGVERALALRRALEATAAVDAEVEAEMAARLEKTTKAGPEEFTPWEPGSHRQPPH